MTARELLTALDGAGVLLTPGADSGRLRVNAPAGCDAVLWLRAVNHPAVQTALELFGGEIVQVLSSDSN